MPLSWNEVKKRAIRFSKEWENAGSEEADAKQFLVDLYDRNTAGLFVSGKGRKGGKKTG